jgi:hypothetical protein
MKNKAVENDCVICKMRKELINELDEKLEKLKK